MDIMGLDAKWWAAGGGVLILGVWYWRKMAANEAPPADVATGEDAAYASGDVQGTTPSLYGYYNPQTGQFIGASGTTQVITTNAQWAQQVLVSMTTSFADTYDPASIALAIANYLAGRALSDNDFNIVETAVQLYGYPPNPPAPPHKASPQSSQNPPPVGTLPSIKPAPPPAPSKPVMVSSTATSITLKWNNPPGTVIARVYRSRPDIPTASYPVYGSIMTWMGLKPATMYYFNVRVWDKYAQGSPMSPTAAGTTKGK